MATDIVTFTVQSAGGTPQVLSVNGQTGVVVLDYEDVGALPDTTVVPTALADLTEDSTHRVVTDSDKTTWNAALQSDDVIDNVTSTTTDKPLSANMGKELQDQVNNLKNIGRFLAIWNSATGLPLTDPTTLPYTYKTGDYFRVGTVDTTTNYKPNGATYTGTASSTVETEDVEVGWVYYYDGSQWLAQSAGGGGLVQDVQINGTTILDSGTGVANIPNSSASASGVMTSSQYTKLDGIEAGAEVNTVDSVDGETGTVVLSDVKYTTQTLTSAQQLQARTNIGAGTPYTVTVDI